MKKTILAVVVLALSTSAFGQGHIDYTIRIFNSVVAHVYGPEVGDPLAAKFGNTASETSAGTQTYTGPFLTGLGWSAQLFAANGSGQPESSLTAVDASITTFRTGPTLAGTVAPGNLQIPGVPEGGTGTFQLRVWNNLGGTVSSWTEAQPFWASGGIPAGKSAVFDIERLSSGSFPGAEMVNFRSFNVYFIPEPGTFVLASLGAAALLLFRRRSGGA